MITKSRAVGFEISDRTPEPIRWKDHQRISALRSEGVAQEECDVVFPRNVRSNDFSSNFGRQTLFTAASLKAHSSKDLAQMAKKKGVTGWHSMRKDQLVKALLKVAKQKEKEKSKQAVTRSRQTSLKSKSTTRKTQSDSVIARKIRLERARAENLKNLSAAHAVLTRNTPPEKDRLVLVVRDSYWLQAYWEITRATVQRA